MERRPSTMTVLRLKIRPIDMKSQNPCRRHIKRRNTRTYTYIYTGCFSKVPRYKYLLWDGRTSFQKLNRQRPDSFFVRGYL